MGFAVLLILAFSYSVAFCYVDPQKRAKIITSYKLLQLRISCSKLKGGECDMGDNLKLDSDRHQPKGR